MEDKSTEMSSDIAVDDAVHVHLPIEPSRPFIGQWNNLVSQTNWEKGRLICAWRAALEAADADREQYSDESWSRMVGDVTAQHVGRLRRTYEKFVDEYEKYKGLYWSHFFAALDWDDAPMWLEGAVQNRWSVSVMRRQRWETLGRIPENEPRIADVIVSELDEGFQPLQFEKQASANEKLGLQASADRGEAPTRPRYDEPDFGDEPSAGQTAGPSSQTAEDLPSNTPPEKLFENLADLPDDVAEAAESMKLAILRHKLAEWEEISLDKFCELLAALTKLAQSPSS